MLRKIREVIGEFLLALAMWVMPAKKEPRLEVVDDIPPQVRKLIDAATKYPLPDRQIEALKAFGPVVRPETPAEKQALKEAIKTAEDPFVDPFEEEIAKAIIDALKDGYGKKEGEESEE